jgi:hypothetical protein
VFGVPGELRGIEFLGVCNKDINID